MRVIEEAAKAARLAFDNSALNQFGSGESVSYDQAWIAAVEAALDVVRISLEAHDKNMKSPPPLPDDEPMPEFVIGGEG